MLTAGTGKFRCSADRATSARHRLTICSSKDSFSAAPSTLLLAALRRLGRTCPRQFRATPRPGLEIAGLLQLRARWSSWTQGQYRFHMSALGHVWTAPWQELSDAAAALVGCGHVFGLFVRRSSRWP